MNLKSLANVEFLKSNKKALICFLAGVLGILLIFISNLIDNKNKEESKSTTPQVSYNEELEEKLQKLISSIDGAGKTSVFLTVEETEEYVYAQDNSSSYKDNSNSSSQNEYVIVDGNNGKDGLLVKTVCPKVRGVAIVCEGGENPKVQQRIYSSVSAALGISTARISISKMTTTEVNDEK